MAIHALSCFFELSDQSFITFTAKQLGIPDPHATFLNRHVQGYRNYDVWGDKALNCPAHASSSRKLTHDSLAAELAAIATQAGIRTTGQERRVPYAEATSKKRGDMVTLQGGVVLTNAQKGFSERTTQLVMDIVLGHVYCSRDHRFKKGSISYLERLKRKEYQHLYRLLGLAFAGVVCNSLGQLGPELLRFLFICATHAARSAL